MSDPLATYLHDHLAGSHFATELLSSMQKQYAGEGLGAFALFLNEELRQDQRVLEQMIDHVGKTQLDLIEAMNWLAEKASQMKLKRDRSTHGIGTFEALELLATGIRGKMALWKALPVIREVDPRLPPYDFQNLIARAEEQYARLEEERLKMVRVTFQPHAVTV